MLWFRLSRIGFTMTVVSAPGQQCDLQGLHLPQIEVSSPQADDLERVRQITQEKDALAQQRAFAEQSRQVCTFLPMCRPLLCPDWILFLVLHHFLAGHPRILHTHMQI